MGDQPLEWKSWHATKARYVAPALQQSLAATQKQTAPTRRTTPLLASTPHIRQP